MTAEENGIASFCASNGWLQSLIRRTSPFFKLHEKLVIYDFEHFICSLEIQTNLSTRPLLLIRNDGLSSSAHTNINDTNN